jgi:hypothetical protein
MGVPRESSKSLIRWPLLSASFAWQEKVSSTSPQLVLIAMAESISRRTLAHRGLASFVSLVLRSVPQRQFVPSAVVVDTRIRTEQHRCLA